MSSKRLRFVLCCLLNLLFSSVALAQEKDLLAKAYVQSMCAHCHEIGLVEQAHLDRSAWQKTLAWMSDEQGMPAMASHLEERVLDYLSLAYGPASSQTVSSWDIGPRAVNPLP